ncbi:MAG: hypothetical protein JWN52_1944 [Actinomycetia bacterium]|nr:hypothetical protein [Actinomycetes bacterium]
MILLACGLAAGVVVGVLLVGQVDGFRTQGVTITAPPVTLTQTAAIAAPPPTPASARPAPAPSPTASHGRAQRRAQPQPHRPPSSAAHATKRPSAASHPRPTHKLGCPVYDDHGNVIAWNC